MKTIFIIVSLVAFTYLVLQTPIVNKVMSKALVNTNADVHRASHTPAKVKQETENDVDSQESQKHIQLDKLDAENQSLQQRVVSLELQLEALKLSMQNTNTDANAFNTVNTAPPALQVHSPNATSDMNKKPGAIVSSPLETSNPVLVDASVDALVDDKVSESQKRLHQQAILRDLAQKMELAALSNFR